jgi:HEAT repeat protein
MFWLSAAAGERLVGPRASFAKEDDATDVKKSAVFALSQRRNGEAVPALIEVARNNRDPEVRKSALFWLGQTMDPRAISLFEDILRK